MNNNNIDIAIVDDDKLVVQLLSDFLREQDNLNIVLTANSGNSFLKQLTVAEKIPDLVLLDLRMDDGDGLETVEKLTILYPELKIIVVSSYYKASSIGYMLKLGVSAFVPKETDKEELVHIIQEVSSKECFFTIEQIQILRNQISHKTPKQYTNPKDSFSSRELEVLQLLCQQLTTKEIAGKLFVSPKTVEAHKSNLLVKTGVKNSVGLIIYAVQNKLINPNEIILLD